MSILNAIALLAFSYEFRVHIAKELWLANIVSLNLQLFCSAVFTAEVLLGVVKDGLVLEKDSYLRSGWNVLSLLCTAAR